MDSNKINISLVSSVCALLASIASPIIFVMNMKAKIESDIRVANVTDVALVKQIDDLKAQIAEIRVSQYAAIVKLNRNSAIISKLDKDGTISKQVMASDHHKGIK